MSEDSGLVSPDQAVVEWLRRMGDISAADRGGEVPSATRLTGPPFPPVLSSKEILKRRVVPGRQVNALAYEDTTGERWFWIIRLIEDEGGSWRVCGGGGGGGAGGGPQRDTPWVNYAGCWGKDGLALGGRVTGTGAERAASARLRMRDTVLVDDVDGGVVLFVTSEPTAGASATIELLAPDGAVLWRDQLELND